MFAHIRGRGREEEWKIGDIHALRVWSLRLFCLRVSCCVYSANGTHILPFEKKGKVGKCEGSLFTPLRLSTKKW